MTLTASIKQITIEKWSSFKGDFPPGAGKHSMVVIFKGAGCLKYFIFTSQVDNAKRVGKNDIGSIAEFSKNDWPGKLIKNCCIQCNKSHLYEIKEDDLKCMYKDGTAEYLGEVPEVIKQGMIRAICDSKTFTGNEKKIYTLTSAA